MNSITTFDPATGSGLWSFSWGINWYHQNGEWHKSFIHTFDVNLFPIKIYHNYFMEETDADHCNQITIPKPCDRWTFTTLPSFESK